MSNSAIRYANYNRSNKIVVTSALAEAFENDLIELNEAQDVLARRVKNENRIFLDVCELAYDLGADLDEIKDLYSDFGSVGDYTVECSVAYWGDYYAGQPLADVLHSSDEFFEMSYASQRSVGQALNRLCDLPVGWVQHCVYARTRGVELQNPTIGWRFTREDVEAAQPHKVHSYRFNLFEWAFLFSENLKSHFIN